MFGSRHIKQYYPEDFICAAVIRSLCRSVADSSQLVNVILKGNSTTNSSNWLYTKANHSHRKDFLIRGAQFETTHRVVSNL